MRVTIVEGTPEEIREAFPHLNASPAAVAVQVPEASVAAADPPTASQGPSGFVSTDVARRVLTRRPLSRELRILLSSLSQAFPDRVVFTELHAATGYSPAQFAGLLGAFGRRVKRTEGYVPDSQFFSYRQDERGVWHIGIPETVKEALELEELAPEEGR